MTETIERLPPHNEEAEQAVLGSVMIDPDYLVELDFLKPEHFYYGKHGWILTAMRQLLDKGMPIDFVTLGDRLRTQPAGSTGENLLDSIGGDVYLVGLFNAVPTAINAVHYGRIVEANYMRRQLIQAASQVANLAYEDDGGDIEEVISKAQHLVGDVAAGTGAKHITHVKEMMANALDHIEKSREIEVTGIPTGYKDLDMILGGLQGGDFIVIGARPGMGKTALMNGMRIAAAKHNYNVGCFDMEMSALQNALRMLAGESRVPSQNLRSGKLTVIEEPQVMEAAGELSLLNIYIDDSPVQTIESLMSRARFMYYRHGINVIFIDYAQLIETTLRSRQEEVSQISRKLKALGRELNIPVVAAAQLSRALESRADKHPQLSDLRESGCLTGDTLIPLVDTGKTVRLDTLVGKANFRTLALDEHDMKIKPAIVSNAFCTGIKRVYEITTNLGRKIKATANHKFLAFDGWRRADKFHEGDFIALPRVNPLSSYHSQENQISRDALAIIGRLIGDGCTLKGHGVQYVASTLELAEDMVQLVRNEFGESVRPYFEKGSGNCFVVYLSAKQNLTHGVRNPIAAWFDSMGIWNKRSHEKYVPQVVFESGVDGIAHFLKHLWATDGHVGLRNKRPEIYYATGSQRLAVNVQSLLLHLGINARIATVPQKKQGKHYRDQYHIHITGKDDVLTFINLIGAVGTPQKMIINQIRDHYSQTEANTNRDVIPAAAWHSIVKPAMKSSMSDRDLAKALEMSYSGSNLYKANLSRARALRVAKATQSEHLEMLAMSDVYWDRIKSIVFIGNEPVYDLTVEGHHNFVANDFIAHNSLEQEADIVMFIYRDEYYNPDTTERPNIAEITIAKHRNGPTGTVDLYWHSRLTTFRNLERMEINLSSPAPWENKAAWDAGKMGNM